MIDIHCHILPAIDDGAPDMETAIEMATVAREDGIECMVATPHTDIETGHPSPDEVRELTRRLNDALRAENVDVTVLAGGEINLSPELVEAADSGSIMTMGDRGEHALIELPFTSYPTFTRDLIFRLQIAGLKPILAHPERSAAAHADLDEIRNLVEGGAMLQINCRSILGEEGRATQRIAQTLLREELVDFLASDAHSPGRRPPLLTPAREQIERIGGEQLFEALTEKNAASLLPDLPHV